MHIIDSWVPGIMQQNYLFAPLWSCHGITMCKQNTIQHGHGFLKGSSS